MSHGTYWLRKLRHGYCARQSEDYEYRCGNRYVAWVHIVESEDGVNIDKKYNRLHSYYPTVAEAVEAMEGYGWRKSEASDWNPEQY